MKILAAAVGNCVHVGGVLSFLEIAKSLGHETVFLGPAVPVKRLVAAIGTHAPDIVAVSYRLSPESAMAVLAGLKEELDKNPESRKRRFFFGGTPPVAKLACATGVFDVCFDGNEPEGAVLAVLKGLSPTPTSVQLSDNLIARIESAYPIPLFRHHFGLPSLKDTLDGAKVIAESGLVDILSIAPDQNAQESFFRPQDMDSRLDGAGGVPLRSASDLEKLREVTRVGNKPLLRCYSGTRDLVKWAEMLRDSINNAWGAIPLTWYSELDGRSKRPLVEAIMENQEAIRWHAERGIPVEINESHQWAIRRSGDVIELATAYLAAYNAKALGVKEYVCQFMFDTPKGISPAMDIAKMLAKADLVQSLAGDGFNVIRMVRSGLASFSPVPSTAKGQLGASVFSAMALKPQIVHVVGFSEGDHAARPEEIIESCAIARGAVAKALSGGVDPQHDPRVASRKTELLAETKLLIEAIKRLRPPNSHDPLTAPDTIAEAIKEGLLDASDLAGNPAAKGRIVTAIIGGACVAVNPSTGKPLTEKERIDGLAVSEKDLDLAEI